MSRGPIISLGEALIDLLSTGITDGVELFRRQPGGAPLNVACGVAKLGVPSAFVGKLGDDMFGRFLVDTAQRAGVDTSGVALTTEAKTGLAFVSLDARGERTFAFYRDPAADMLLRDADLPASIDRCAALHHGSISLVVEPARHATLEAVRRARAGGAVISFDPNLRPALWPSLDDAKRTILAALGSADVVKVSREELDFLTDGDVARILDAGPRLVLVTDGPAGVHVHGAGAALHVPAFAVDVVDTTGAGDAFCAGFLARIALADGAGLPTDRDLLVEAATWGAAAGAVCCTGKGAIDPLPTRAALTDFMRAQGR